MRQRLFFPSIVSLVLLASAAIAGDRKSAEAAMLEGARALQMGDTSGASVHLLNALKADPDYAKAHQIYARILIDKESSEYALKAIDRAASLGIPATQLNHLRGAAALLQGDTKKAIELVQPENVNPIFHGYAARVLGNALAASGNFDGAGKAFDDAARLTPKSAQLWTDMGRFRFSIGNIAGAIEAGNNAVRFGPNSVAANTLMGELSRGQFGLTAAIPWFEKALSIDARNLPALTELAATYGDAGRNKDMLAITRRMLAVDEGNPQAYYYQAVLAARANKPGLARSLLTKTGGRLDDVAGVMLLRGVIEMQSSAYELASKQFTPLLAMQPGNDTVRRLLGACHFALKDNDSAIAVLSPLAQRGDADSYALTVIGRAYEAKGDRVAAAEYLDRAMSGAKGASAGLALNNPEGGGDPNDASVAVPEISRLLASGRGVEALSRARFVLSRNPGVPAAYMLVGDALDGIGRPGEAAESYRQAANIRFNEAVALRLARTLVRANKASDALRVIDLYVSQNPKSVAGRYLAADVFLVNKGWNEAIAVLEGLRTQLGNRDSMLLNNLAWAHLNAGNKEKALGFAYAAYQLNPMNPVIANGWGWTLFKTGKNKAKGLALIEKSVEIAPGNLGFRYQFAQAAAELGRKGEAKKALQVVLAARDFGERKGAEALLKQL